MNWTRRKFLNSSLAAPALISVSDLSRANPASAGEALTSEEQATLKAAIDEIIPAGDGMPSASEAGGVAYLVALARTESGGIGKEIRKCLSSLNGKDPFDRLSPEARVSVLKAYEESAPQNFALFRDCVYESYYTQPSVWRLIGYELYPTDHPGPHMKPFDENVLTEMRKRPKFYREV
ncbi:MAG: gluconate 2-dehydrogenase subunit 3 family protein [Bryobacteraceae bacterium]